jgi:hypothetical protein
MRVHRSLPFLTILAAVAACSSPGESASAQPDAAAPVTAAPAPVAEAPAPPAVAINVRWDSGPLDLAYRNERRDLDAVHVRERANPRAGESSAQRTERQSKESSALEARYTQGKKDHAHGMPPR